MKQSKTSRRKYTTSSRSNKARAENWALLQLAAAKGNTLRAIYEVMRTMDNKSMEDKSLHFQLDVLERKLQELLNRTYSVVTEIQSHRLSNQTKKD